MPAATDFACRYDIFISYSHADREWVRQTLLPRVENGGLKAYIDYRDAEIGVPAVVNMETAVKNSRFTVLVLTPSWLDSVWCDFEGLLASTKDPAGRQKRVLPLRLIPCGLPARLNMLTYADFSDPARHNDEFHHLLQQIHRDLGSDERNDDPPIFIAGIPITKPCDFFGRAVELDRIFKLLKSTPLQNSAIIGPRRSGKTSLLWYLKSITTTPLEQLRHEQRHAWLKKPGEYRWVFVDFQDHRMSSREKLLNHLLQSMGLPTRAGCDIDNFMDTAGGRLHNPTVILLDEISVALQRYTELDDTFWEGLRSFCTTQAEGRLAFVLASHESPAKLAQLNGHTSPFWNIFGYTATLGPLSPSEARQLIARSPLAFAEEDMEWILSSSDCWPMKVQLLCRERLDSLENGEEGIAWRERGLEQLKNCHQMADLLPA
jgi:hypothetical protein